jgi:hypothetical protein
MPPVAWLRPFMVCGDDRIEVCGRMTKPLQVSTFALRLMLSALVSQGVVFVAYADKAKTPPPKDPASKPDTCVTGDAKTAGKTFCAVDDFVRGRVAKSPSKMHTTAASGVTTNGAVERSLGAKSASDAIACSGLFQWIWCRMAK